MSRLREMEMFVRVVDAGSFSSAAHDLKIGQPAISKTIASLEDRLGVRLLVRSTRRLTPTEAGVAFYERALRAITEANEADAAARGVAASLEGRLRISAAVTFSRIHVVPRLAEFLDAHPRLELELVMDDCPRDLVAENIDAALRLGALTDSSLRARKLAQSDRLVVASPAYLARRGTPSTPADLLNHDSIIYSQDWRRGMVLPPWIFGNIDTPSQTADDYRSRRRPRRRHFRTGFLRRLALDVRPRARIRRSRLCPE
jgi:DNA-binding transcriptional LysR family regulator